jgi:iron(III) transport system substrate-binding protein
VVTRPNRRKVIAGAGALLGASATRVLSAAPPAVGISTALIEAARKEAKVNWYTAMDLIVAEKWAKVFEGKFPGVAVRVERSGSERLFQRIGQEMAAGIRNVDIVNTADAAHVLPWKRNGWLAAFVPEEVAAHYAPSNRDPDGYAVTARMYLSVIGVNTKLVAPTDMPASFADLLDPKWAGKLVKGHPGYSGTIMSATYQMVQVLGWGYFEKLAKQRVMQVQSSVDPPKKIALGERAVMVDGGDYNVVQHKEQGAPVEIVYASEGTPSITSPNCIFAGAVNPNAARLLQCWMTSAEGQQSLVDISGQYPIHKLVKAKAGRKPLSEIKLMTENPAGVDAESEAITARYTALFRV